MAEPLTSSDIIRERMGFGVSPLASGETRRAYSEAGLSPLGTQERERFERGAGISPMASTAEKDAWVAAEVMAGQRDPMELPKDYGGLGDRPEATTRRGLRMQQEWDKQYEMMVNQQEVARQVDIEEKKYAIDLAREERQKRTEEASIDVAYAKEMRDLEIEKQSDRAMKSIIGTTLPNGQRTRPINVNEDDAVERIQSVVASNPYGMESQIVKETVSMMLNDALNIRQGKIDQSKQQELAAANLSARTLKPMSEFGEYNEQGIFQPNIKGMIAGAEEVKATESAQEEKRTIEKERRGEEARAGVRAESDIVSEEKRIRGDVRRAKDEFRKLNASFAGRKSLSATQQASLKAARDTILDLEIEKADLRGLVFDTEQEAEAANPPSGSIIYIGRKPNTVP